jgi:hypothetical protein
MNRCRVIVSHKKLYESPIEELNRIGLTLRRVCHIRGLYNNKNSSQIKTISKDWIRPNLRHHNLISDKVISCHTKERKCKKTELELFETTIKLFNDMENQLAFKRDYNWTFAITAILSDHWTPASRYLKNCTRSSFL